MALIESNIRKLPIPAREKLIGDGRGLYIRCYPSGRRSWLFRTRVGGSWKTRNLGEWPGVTLAEARHKAAALAGKLLPEAVTFGDLLDDWYQRQIEPHYRVTRNIETYVAKGKAWAGNDRLSNLSAARLSALLTQYAEDAPVAANRCLSNWKLALDYAVERGYIERNPLARTTAKSVGGKETPRDRTLDDEEIRALWAQPSPPCTPAQVPAAHWAAYQRSPGRPHRAYRRRPSAYSREQERPPALGIPDSHRPHPDRGSSRPSVRFTLAHERASPP